MASLFCHLNTLYQNINSMMQHFNQSVSESALWMFDRSSNRRNSHKFICSAQIEMQETTAEIILGLKIPDVVARSVDLHVTEESVCVQGEQLKLRKAGSSDTAERYSQQFQYLIPLPGVIDVQTAIAELNGDFLVLILQKSKFPRLWIQINFSRNSKTLLDRCLRKTASY